MAVGTGDSHPARQSERVGQRRHARAAEIFWVISEIVAAARRRFGMLGDRRHVDVRELLDGQLLERIV
jgi:hypothetical protein